MLHISTWKTEGKSGIVPLYIHQVCSYGQVTNDWCNKQTRGPTCPWLAMVSWSYSFYNQDSALWTILQLYRYNHGCIWIFRQTEVGYTMCTLHTWLRSLGLSIVATVTSCIGKCGYDWLHSTSSVGPHQWMLSKFHIPKCRPSVVQHLN